MQQLMTLWTEFQAAEKLHMNRMREMEQRLQRVSSFVIVFMRCYGTRALWQSNAPIAMDTRMVYRIIKVKP